MEEIAPRRVGAAPLVCELGTHLDRAGDEGAKDLQFALRKNSFMKTFSQGGN